MCACRSPWNVIGTPAALASLVKASENTVGSIMAPIGDVKTRSAGSFPMPELQPPRCLLLPVTGQLGSRDAGRLIVRLLRSVFGSPVISLPLTTSTA